MASARAQVVGGSCAVARGQVLVDEVLRLAALLGRHAAVAGGGRGVDLGWRPRPKRVLGHGPTAHRSSCATMVIGIDRCSGYLALRSPSTTSGGAGPLGSPRGGVGATCWRPGRAGRRSAAPGAWPRRHGCRRSRSRPPSGSPRSWARSNVADSRAEQGRSSTILSTRTRGRRRSCTTCGPSRSDGTRPGRRPCRRRTAVRPARRDARRAPASRRSRHRAT